MSQQKYDAKSRFDQIKDMVKGAAQQVSMEDIKGKVKDSVDEAIVTLIASMFGLQWDNLGKKFRIGYGCIVDGLGQQIKDKIQEEVTKIALNLITEEKVSQIIRGLEVKIKKRIEAEITEIAKEDLTRNIYKFVKTKIDEQVKVLTMEALYRDIQGIQNGNFQDKETNNETEVSVLDKGEGEDTTT